jgi:hypothetical protein
MSLMMFARSRSRNSAKASSNIFISIGYDLTESRGILSQYVYLFQTATQGTTQQKSLWMHLIDEGMFAGLMPASPRHRNTPRFHRLSH